MAISTTLVGVAVFSDTRNRSVRIEKVQISMPLGIPGQNAQRKKVGTKKCKRLNDK